MARAGRFSTVAPLPPHGEWRRVLALDRGAAGARPVVLAFVPTAVLDAPERLAALVRDVEAAARLHHPSAVTVLGTETVGDALAVVEDWRPAATLREILDAGGRLPPDVAARIAVDVCGALGRAHATDAGDGRRLAHGAVSASHVLVAEDGVARLCGFGEGAGAEPADDLRALAAVLFECLAGEPHGPGAPRLDAPGIPAALAVAVDRAVGAVPDAPYASAAALGEAIAAARVASQADVASYAEAILPPEEGGRAAFRRALARVVGDDAEEVSDDLIVEPTDPATARPGASAELPSAELPRPPQTRPGVDPAGVFRAPPPVAPRAAIPVVVGIATLCALGGFGIGFALSRARSPEPPPVALVLPPPGGDADVATGDVEGQATTPASGAPRAHAASATARAKAGRASASKSAKGAKVAKVAAQRPEAPAGKGTLAVSAPEDADVILDGKRVGRGHLKLEIAAGVHHLEVRRGDAKVEQAFSVEPNETWTYDVTPTP